MLNTIHKDFELMSYDEQLEDFLAYCERRALDLAKDPTYVPGKKPAKKREPKGRTVTLNKLSRLDESTLALLRKAGIDI